MSLDSHELPDGRVVKLGRPEVSPESPKDLHLRRFLLPPAELPKPPEIIDNTVFVRQPWGMYANDQHGCCLVEGTQVVAPGAYRGFRVPYSGPVVTLLTRDGHQLTVTPNHMVLTPRGFLPARFIQSGDYVVSNRFPEQVARTFDPDFNQSPTPVEEVFATLRRIGLTCRVVRQRMPVAFDLHGDERFMDGDVDVVGTDSFLQGELDAALSQPHSEREVVSVGELKSALHRLRPSLKGCRAGWPTTLSVMGRSSDSSAFFDRHTAVAHAEVLSLGTGFDAGLYKHAHEGLGVHAKFGVKRLRGFAGAVARDGSRDIAVSVLSRDQSRSGESYRISDTPYLKASIAQPTADGRPTDSHLPANLIQRFPTLVTTEQVTDIQIDSYHGYVYDLSTDSRWLTANHIVTHNCVFASSGHRRVTQAAMNDQQITITDDEVLHAYSAVTGFDPSDPSTDNGAVMVDAANWERHNDLGGDRVFAFARIRIDPRDQEMLDLATYYLGGVWFGINLPRSAQRQVGQVWDVADGPDGQPGSWGGHAVWSPKSSPDCREVVTWAKMQRCTHEFIGQYADEAWSLLPAAWQQEDPFGAIDWAALEAAIAQFGPVDPAS